MRVAIVGPCGAGKSTLEQRLRKLGYDAHSCAQEHSYVPDMWRLMCNPDVLIYLDADLPTIARRQLGNWMESDVELLRRRLLHARAHCDFYLATDDLTADEVQSLVVQFLETCGLIPSQNT